MRKLNFWAKCEMIFFMILPFLTLIVGMANFIALIFAIFHLKKFIGLILILVFINELLALYMAKKYCQGEGKITLKIVFLCSGMVIYNIILFPSILIAFYRKITHQKKWLKTAHSGLIDG